LGLRRRHVKFNESITDALKREVHEEYGTQPKKFEFLGFDEVFREQNTKLTHWITFRYKVLLDREKAVINESDKFESLLWTTLEKLPSPLHSQLPHVLEKYKNQL